MLTRQSAAKQVSYADATTTVDLFDRFGLAGAGDFRRNARAMFAVASGPAAYPNPHKRFVKYRSIFIIHLDPSSAASRASSVRTCSVLLALK